LRGFYPNWCWSRGKLLQSEAKRRVFFGCGSFALGEKMTQTFQDGYQRKHYLVDEVEKEIEKRLGVK
jgi:hypothetical protein